MKFRQTLAPLLLSVGSLIASFGSASAAVIYFDDFNGTGSLGGTTPDTSAGIGGGVAGATWSSGTQFGADGVLSGSTGSASLAFTPQSGNTYTLSATVDPGPPGSSEWIALGFSSSSNPDANFVANGGAAWMLLRGVRTGADAIQTFSGPGIEGAGNHDSATGAVNLKIVLDTTGALWTTTWFLNETEIRTATYTTNPTINYVSLGKNGLVDGTFDNFSLTVTPVPEPSAILLLGAGGVVATGIRRRR